MVKVMFDLFRELRKSDEEKRQETITAYLDGYLTPGQRRRFEKELAADPELRQEVEQQSFIKNNLRQLPQVRAPRNFTLDPALYGAPKPEAAVRLYPVLRTATVLVGIFFVIAVGAALLIPQGGDMESLALAPMAEEIAGDVRSTVPEAEQELMEVPQEEEAAPMVETEMLAEEEIVSEAEMSVEVPAEEAAAEEMVAGTPAAETARDPTLEAAKTVDGTQVEDAVVQEAEPEGELEETDSGVGAAAPITTEDRQLTAEAAAAGGAGPGTPAGTPAVEAPAEEAMEAVPAEPLPTASSPPLATLPPSTPSTLAGVEPTPPDAGTAVGQAAPQEEAPAEEEQDLARDAGPDLGRILFRLLAILAVVSGVAVIVLSAATLLVRRKI